MNRWNAVCAAVAVLTAVGAGCNSNEYQPNASDAQLAAYAAHDKYPADLPSTKAENVFYSINDDGVITLNNAGDESLSNFDLWVNKSYVIMVDQLPAHSLKTFPPERFYNSAGTSLKSESVSQNWTVQLRAGSRLLDAKGPVKM